MPTMIVFDFIHREVRVVGPDGETHRANDKQPLELVGTATPPLQPQS